MSKFDAFLCKIVGASSGNQVILTNIDEEHKITELNLLLNGTKNVRLCCYKGAIHIDVSTIDASRNVKLHAKIRIANDHKNVTSVSSGFGSLKGDHMIENPIEDEEIVDTEDAGSSDSEQAKQGPQSSEVVPQGTIVNNEIDIKNDAISEIKKQDFDDIKQKEEDEVKEEGAQHSVKSDSIKEKDAHKDSNTHARDATMCEVMG